MNRLTLILLGAVGLFLAGLSTGWWLQRPRPVVEPPAPASRQADGSLVLERTGTQIAPQKPPHALPKGAKEERRVSVVVQPPRGTTFHSAESGRVGGNQVADVRPEGGNNAPLVPPPDSCECPPVQVDLSLVRMPDHSRRVIASSPSGKILSGIDVPISAPAELAARPWAAGILITSDRKFGGFLDRDVGPFRFGVESFQSTNGWTAQARAGIRF